MTSLDGEDAALLSEFLSRAQAKRAANAAMAMAMGDSKAEKDERDMSSPVVRRVLEELDVNSPSIQKATPKAEGEEISSPTTACRRSTRTQPRAQTRSLRPAVPNQIPVRRANGTEFVFLQRTEAQELALATRKNTRRNKGNSVLPKYMLQALNKQDKDVLQALDKDEDVLQALNKDEDVLQALNKDKDVLQASNKQDKDVQSEHSESAQPQSRHAPRRVLWRDDKLVEYAPEKTFESPSPGKKSRAKAKTDTLPATPSKKARRINMAETSTRSVSNNPFATPVGTPIPKRKLAARRTTTAPAAATKASGIPRKSLSAGTPMVKRVRAKRVFS